MSLTPQQRSIEHYWKPDGFEDLDEPYDLDMFELWDFERGPTWFECWYEFGTDLEEDPFRKSPLAAWQRGLPALAFTDVSSDDLFCLEGYLAAIRLVVVDEEGLRRPNWTNSEELVACGELAAQALVAAELVSDSVGVWIHLEDDPSIAEDPQAIAVAKALADDAEDAFALFVRVVDLQDGRRIMAFGPEAVPDLILACTQ